MAQSVPVDLTLDYVDDRSLPDRPYVVDIDHPVLRISLESPSPKVTTKETRVALLTPSEVMTSPDLQVGEGKRLNRFDESDVVTVERTMVVTDFLREYF